MTARELTLKWAGIVTVAFAAAGCAGSAEGPAPSPDVTISVSVGPAVDPPSDEIRIVLRVPADPRVVPPADAIAGVGWAPNTPGVMWVMTFGSSSNPLVASEVTADGQTITVPLAEMLPGEPASADHVPWTSSITVPASVDPTTPITVVLGDLGSAELTGSEAWVLATP